MVTNKTHCYGIKYKVVKVESDKILLIPECLVGGLSDSVSFSTDHGDIPILTNKDSFSKKHVVSNIYYTNDLEKKYDYYEDTNLLGKFFYEDNAEIVLYVKALENGELKIYKLDTAKYRKNKLKDSKVTYYLEDGESCALLNEKACDEILSCNSMEEVKKIMEKYVSVFKDFDELSEMSVSRIDLVNNKVVSMESSLPSEEGDYEEAAKEVNVEKHVNIAKNVESEPNTDITRKGLYNAIRDNVFGHDKEIGIISRRLYRNYIGRDGRNTKSILIVGPSGTGKTETIKCAANYLGLPYSYLNASTLVSTGIVGPKIEDAIIDLYYQSGKKMPIAERGFVFLDEYDKIGSINVKSEVKSELLTFNGGEKILIPQLGRGTKFDSSKTMKVYGGVFERLYNKSAIGFGSTDGADVTLSGPEIKRLIVKNNYFTKEEISRIPTVVRYDYLDSDTKKDALLHAKSSYLLECIRTYKEDFGVDIVVSEDFLDALLDLIPQEEGFRDIVSYIDEILDGAEEELCDVPKNTYKKLVLTKDIVEDNSKFKLY